MHLHRIRAVLQTLSIVLAATAVQAPAQVSRTADLIDTLHRGTIQARRDAARALGRARPESKQVVEALIDAL
ncbi:MAG TPA: hypothetical protein VEO56_14270, partial [Bacteroidota bacterium]|nr:hypothetical protein [Bacteroidota bacterium]